MSDSVKHFGHDLKNILSMMIGYLNLIQKKMNAGEEWNHQKVYLEKAVALAMELNEQFNDALLDNNTEEFHLRDLLTEFLKYYEEVPVELVSQFTGNPTLQINKNSFKRIVNNLIRNSLEQGAKNILITLNNHALVFHDDAGGINSEILLGINSNKEISSKGVSRGLGIKSTKKLCQKLGWKIQFENKVRYDLVSNKIGLKVNILLKTLNKKTI